MNSSSEMTVVISPVQLAAVLNHQAISSAETRNNRLMGGLKAIAGTLEMVGAAALLLAPEPTMATKVGGVALAVHGSDTISAGFWQAWTGQPRATLTEQASTELALRLGADPREADRIGTAVDIAVPLVITAGIGAARIAAIRAGRISLIEHEAVAGSRVGGHTILKHVGKTEAELRARLVAQRNISAASTFKSLDAAERTLYLALRTNKVAIETWARTAAPGTKYVFEYASQEIVGEGILRGGSQLVQMSRVQIVLKMEQYRGKLYYILTAYPKL